MEAAMTQIGPLLVNFERREISQQGLPLRIGARAFDILAVLFRADGTIVSKDAIMDAVWPGLVVEENRLQVHIAALRKMLGDDRELIKTVPGRGYLLVPANRSALQPALQLASRPSLQPAVQPASQLGKQQAPQPERPRAKAPQDGGLPACAATLVGRQAEIEQIIGQLQRVPVTTLVGAGGIGKTSLAVHVAREMRERFGARICFVELARASTRDAVFNTVACALGIATSDRVPGIVTLADAIAASPCLLVLDNAEHVIDVVAKLVDDLLGRNDALQTLVTSREPLQIWAESVVRVEPLAVPVSGSSAVAILAHSAVELFLHRARAIAPDCATDESSIRLVADICRRLEGLPLAIELAAARVATLGIEGVGARLDDRLNLLTGGVRSALPRHQTLRATFDWSYALLDDTSRMLFRRLGFFAGLFTFDAVCAVATEPDIPIASVISSLSELAAKSLLTVEFSGAIAQYRLTECTRAYAMEKLTDEGELRRIAARHMHYLQERIEQRAVIASEADCAATQAQPRLTLDDARSAFDWAFSAGGDPALGVALAGSLVGTLLEASLLDECYERAKRALDALDSLPPGSIDVVCEMRLWSAFASASLYTVGAVPQAASAWKRVLVLARDSGDATFEARALWGLWNTMLAMGDVHESFRYATRFQQYTEHRGTPWQKLLAAEINAVSLHCFGEHEQARERLEAAMSALDALGRPAPSCGGLAVDPLIFANGTLARIVALQGNPERAMQLVDKAVNQIRVDSLEPSLSHVLAMAAVPIALLCGDLRAASRYLRVLQSQVAVNRFGIWQAFSECLAGHLEMVSGCPSSGLARLEPALQRLLSCGFRRLITPLIAACAEALARVGRIAEARVKLEEALRFCKASGEHLYVPEVLRVKGWVVLEQARTLRGDCTGSADCADSIETAQKLEAEGRRYLVDAMQVAREHNARLWELRAALDLAGHLIDTQCIEQAASLLRDMAARVDLQTNSPDIRRLVRMVRLIDIVQEKSAKSGLNRQTNAAQVQSGETEGRPATASIADGEYGFVDAQRLSA